MDMSTIKDDSGEYWQEFGPLLDEAITQLGTEDRKAIILRFFERLDFRAIGKALGSNEDAARSRVSRALDKLQVLLKHRGISSSAVALGTALAAEPAASAAEFSGNVAAAALAKANAGFACGTIKATLMKLTTMTKLQTAIFGAVVIAGLTGSLVFRHQARVLDEENGELRRQMVQLQSDYNLVSSRLAHVSQSGLRSDRLRELLRLRNEVGSLRRQQRELERIAATTKSIPSNQGNQNTPFGSPPPSRLLSRCRWFSSRRMKIPKHSPTALPLKVKLFISKKPRYWTIQPSVRQVFRRILPPVLHRLMWSSMMPAVSYLLR